MSSDCDSAASKPISVMKYILKSLIPLWILLGLVGACFGIMISFLLVSEYQSHHEWSPHFPAVYLEMEGKAKWVSEFRHTHGAFPTREEVSAQYPPNGFYLETDPTPWAASWGNQGEAFVVHQTVGEWNLSLQSWDGGRREVYNE